MTRRGGRAHQNRGFSWVHFLDIAHSRKTWREASSIEKPRRRIGKTTQELLFHLQLLIRRDDRQQDLYPQARIAALGRIEWIVARRARRRRQTRSPRFQRRCCPNRSTECWSTARKRDRPNHYSESRNWRG